MKQISRRKFIGLIAGASTIIFTKLNSYDQFNKRYKYKNIYQQWINEKHIEPTTYLSESTIHEAISKKELEDLIIDDFNHSRVFIVDGLVLSEIEGALVASFGVPS